MNFLAPLFLAGAVAVGLPVIFHLIRRTTRERKVFGSLMFLKSTPPRLTRRNRLEHIALLLLRSAAICLLALAFARPFIKHILPAIPSSEVPKKIVILVDTSASMRRANLWSQARERVTALVRKASPVDRVALFGFDRQLRPLMTFEEWSSLAAGDRAVRASSRLAETKPGWSATRAAVAGRCDWEHHALRRPRRRRRCRTVGRSFSWDRCRNPPAPARHRPSGGSSP